jgi:hypothetical protein
MLPSLKLVCLNINWLLAAAWHMLYFGAPSFCHFSVTAPPVPSLSHSVRLKIISLYIFGRFCLFSIDHCLHVVKNEHSTVAAATTVGHQYPAQTLTMSHVAGLIPFHLPNDSET